MVALYPEAPYYPAVSKQKAGTSRRFIVKAIDPETGRPELEVLYPTHRLQWAKRMGKGALKEIGESVKAVLEAPCGIYRGVQRDSDDDNSATEGWLCYTGIPACRYDYYSGNPLPTKNRVLLVFVNDDGAFYQHRWEEEDEDNPGHPKDCDGRFKERLI